MTRVLHVAFGGRACQAIADVPQDVCHSRSLASDLSEVNVQRRCPVPVPYVLLYRSLDQTGPELGRIRKDISAVSTEPNGVNLQGPGCLRTIYPLHVRFVLHRPGRA